MNQTIVFAKLPGETQEDADARIKAAQAEFQAALAKKADLLKKAGMA